MTTLTQPRIKSANRKAKSIRQITPTYYEVTGDTGNVYHIDTFFGECSCPAGQHGKDCYHQLAVREYQQAQLNQVVDIRNGATLGQALTTCRDYGFTPVIEKVDHKSSTVTVKLLRFGRAIAFLEINKLMSSVEARFADSSKFRYCRWGINNAPLIEALNRLIDEECSDARLSIFGL